MKIGLKLFPDKLDLIEPYKDLFDFFELYIKPDMDLSSLRKFNISFTIHAAHQDDGFDPSDPSARSRNIAIVNKAKEAADIVGSPWIILHPGFRRENGYMEEMVSFFREVHDARYVIENMPACSMGPGYACTTPHEMEYLMKKTGLRCMLDFAHATSSANHDGDEPMERIRRFMALRPACFHLSGIDEDSLTDMHKHLFEVHNGYPFLDTLPHDAWVTLETNQERVREREVHEENIRIVKSHMQKVKQ